ncbi:MAG: type III pantothenate kinase [Rikenellaceae bacterium]
MSCNLIVDIGNSRVKCAVMADQVVLKEWNVGSFSEFEVDSVVAEYSPQRSIVTSTRGDGAEVCAILKGKIGHSLHFCAGVATPLTIDYSTPHSLGADRVAVAVGLINLSKGRDTLIIDCGTAITIDLMTRDGVFRGGFISAGLSLRYQALSGYTAALPLCSPPSELCDGVAPRSTSEAIEQGVFASAVYEIEGHINHFSKKYDNLLIFFVGGEAFRFEKRIKNAIFAGRETIFCGLNKILEYNAGN